jgi:hypothetical protein
VPEGFTFSPDGQYLYGSSYFTGVSNIFRYRLADKALDAVSNADVGFFHPVSLPDGKLMVLRYSGTGLLPTVIEPKPTEELGSITFLGEQVATRYPAVLAWQPKVVPDKDYDARIIARGDYQPLREVKINHFIPGVAAYKRAKAVGLSTQFSDPLNRAWGKADLSYTPGQCFAGKRAHPFQFGYGKGALECGREVERRRLLRFVRAYLAFA